MNQTDTFKFLQFVPGMPPHCHDGTNGKNVKLPGALRREAYIHPPSHYQNKPDRRDTVICLLCGHDTWDAATLAGAGLAAAGAEATGLAGAFPCDYYQKGN
jgi:hypothetical protein